MKYKLIKTYPGSPKLGCIVEKTKDNCDIYWFVDRYQSTINGETVLGYNKNIIENSPEFWELIVEKEYEILQYKGKISEGLYTLIPDKGYKFSLKGDLLDGKIHDFLTVDSYKPLLNIYSVKRLSDGEVFTVGDRVNSSMGLAGPFIITDFVLEPRKGIKLGINWAYSSLEFISKVKQPLFTTKDGVDIFEGDDFYELIVPGFHNKECVWNILPNIGRPNLIYDQEGNRKHFRLWFSTQEKAEEYIIMNKPCLSYNDVVKNSYSKEDCDFMKRMRSAVKEKLKL